MPDATLRNPVLIRALFDVYVGDDAPVSARAKATFERNWADLIATDGVVVTVERAVPSVVPSSPGAGAAGGATDERSVDASPAGSLTDKLRSLFEKARARILDDNGAPSSAATGPAVSVARAGGEANASATVSVVREAVVDMSLVDRIVLAEHNSRTK